MPGTIVALGAARAEGAPVEPRDSVHLAVAYGVAGDRYAEDKGHFRGFPDQEVTLVEAEDAEAAGVEPLATRRNLVTRGVRLEELVGRSFRVGAATLHGILEIASPQTRKNLATNPEMEINVVDATSRRGYRFLGRASVHTGDEPHRAAQERVFREDQASTPIAAPSCSRSNASCR